jgi:DNA-binding NarL/FixJ family response regulator
MMGWFDFLSGRKRRHSKTNRHRNSLPAFQRQIKADIVSLQSQVQAVDATMQQHSATLLEHKGILEEHMGKFLKLEQLVERPAIDPYPSSQDPKPSADVSAMPSSPQKCSIESFSPQEKRLLQVFFQHLDMPLSYTDIGRALGKSPNTIKNQIHQIGMKADLFTKSVDADSRNRFKLKEGVRLEKYLNLG